MVLLREAVVWGSQGVCDGAIMELKKGQVAMMG